MWKIELVCDACGRASIKGSDKGSNDALRAAKEAARQVGWTHVRNVGWICAHCILNPRIELGDRAYYTGSIMTPMLKPLKGMEVKIIERMDQTRTVWAVFTDPAAGRWAEHPHWFFDSEFSPEPLEVQIAAE